MIQERSSHRCGIDQEAGTPRFGVSYRAMSPEQAREPWSMSAMGRKRPAANDCYRPIADTEALR